MEPKLEQYLDEIGMPAPFKVRLDQIVREFSPLLPEPVQQLFVTDLFDGENVRRYASAWLFSQNCAMEMKNFIVNESLDFIILAKNVRYLEVSKVEFDFVNPTAKSRLTAHGAVGLRQTSFTMNASANNCLTLAAILRERLIPNIAP